MKARVVGRMRSAAVVVTRLTTAIVLGLLAIGVWLDPSWGTDATASAASDDQPLVLATTIDTSITPVVADQIADGLDEAADRDLDAYVIELDTPGGLVDSTRDIVADILASPLPVIVYVSPSGARAGSAGAVITFASHVAVMAPGTTIGAATPVGLGGDDLSTKIVNDAAAQAEALATLRGRNVEFAGDTVRDGRTATAAEAVELGAVDGEASSLAEALDVADGRTVTVAGDRRVTVDTAGASVERYDMGFVRQVLQFLANPEIAFLLLIIGMLGLIFELASPGVGVAGTIGAVALVLALFSLSLLPVDVVGLLLLALAGGLFLAEVLAPGIGAFAVGGAIALVCAAIFLFDDAEGASVDLVTVLPLALVMLVAAVFVGRLARRTRGAPSVTTGLDVFAGRSVPVRNADGATGTSYAEGAWWSLRSIGPPLRVGSHVRVVGVDGLTLLVDPDAPEQQTSDPGRDDA